LFVGTLLWWIVVTTGCSDTLDNDNSSCDAFFPHGSYFNMWDNAGAVLFLRIVVWSGILVVLALSALVVDVDLGPLLTSCPLRRCISMARMAMPCTCLSNTCGSFEVFYYIHLAVAAIILGLALSARFEVFYPVMPTWTWYLIDALLSRRGWFCDLNCMPVFDAETVGDIEWHPSGVIAGNYGTRLVLKNSTEFKFKAGQTVYLQIASIDWGWHPFSIASHPGQSLTFLIKKVPGTTWTSQLYEIVDKRRELRVKVMGPFGSSFQSALAKKAVILVGGGAGLPSTLSVLQEILASGAVEWGGQSTPTAAGTAAQHVHLVWVLEKSSDILWC
jgi:hypothetical protein